MHGGFNPSIGPERRFFFRANFPALDPTLQHPAQIFRARGVSLEIAQRRFIKVLFVWRAHSVFTHIHTVSSSMVTPSFFMSTDAPARHRPEPSGRNPRRA